MLEIEIFLKTVHLIKAEDDDEDYDVELKKINKKD